MKLVLNSNRGTRVYSSSNQLRIETFIAHQVNAVNLNTGGGSFTLSVEKDSGTPLTDIPVYVFSSSGSYLGINARTDAQGDVSFDLADGDYKFRADYFGYQFWSNDYTVPGTLSDVLTITHQDVTVTVNQVYGVDIDPLQGINVYLFTGSGAYQEINQPTNANGQVTFNVPEKEYMVRADYLSQQYWSDVFSWQDVVLDIDHGTAVLHVTESGLDLYDVPVYLFTETGSYLSRLERTDSSGQVQFLLPANSYKFRVDYDGTQYWSDVISIIPNSENNIDLQLELLAELLADLTHDPNPDRLDGVAPVYEPKKVMVASLSSIRGLLVQSVVGQTGEDQKIYYFINDHLGTPQKLLNENADVVWKADYKPFGEADVYVSTFENRFRFPGQYEDTETGLHYNYQRYYDPVIGRYLTPDPIGFLGRDLNLFAYCLNNSINEIDPFGLQQYNAANAYHLLHHGYKSPQVVIPWRDYGNAIIEATKSAATSTKDFLFNDPCSELSAGEKAQIAVQGVIERSGLHNLQGTAVEASLILVTAEGVIWGYAFYPLVLNQVLTRPQETLDFAEAFIPASLPKMSPGGLTGYAVGRTAELFRP